MIQPDDFQLVLCTCPDQASAEHLATQVISNQVAGCVSILPQIRSIYRWQGKIENQSEFLLLIKSHKDVYSKLEQILTENHPYEVPEIIALAINRGLPEYLTWLQKTLNE